MTENQKCLTWGTECEDNYSNERSSTTKLFNSPRAGGMYTIDWLGLREIDQINMQAKTLQRKALLTTWLIDQRKLGKDIPEITGDVVIKCGQNRPLLVHERADKLLVYIRNKTPLIGVPYRYAKNRIAEGGQSRRPENSFLEMLAWSECSESNDSGELEYLMKFLENSKFIDKIPDQKGFMTDNNDFIFEYEGLASYSITPDGYAHLAKLESAAPISEQVFIAMWFDPSMKDIYDKAIAPAVEKAGYKSVRIDSKEHNNKIDDEIIAEIRRSRFMIADFTQGDDGMRGGVYYEAGFARGLGLDVISTCRQNLLDGNKIHFDTR